MWVSYKRDEKAFGDFRDSIHRLADPTLLDTMAKRLAPKFNVELDRTFVSQEDPYGVAWKRRKNLYPWPILDHTGRLKRSLSVTYAGNGTIDVKSTVKYAEHVDKERPIVPRQRRGLPKAWKKLVEREFDRVFKEARGR